MMLYQLLKLCNVDENLYNEGLSSMYMVAWREVLHAKSASLLLG